VEIRQVVRGNRTSFAQARPAKREETGTAAAGRPSSDRVELSQQWTEHLEQQRAQVQAALLAGKQEKKSGGILDMLDGPDSQELDAQMEALRVQQKCMEISRRIMAGKRVPPEDEQYLMEHDPEGYKLTIALRRPPKDDEECESVLDEEDRGSGETAGTGEAAPAEGGGDAPSSGGGESAV
jgi:hypothetical protein